jgi:hypothetical protein
MAQHIKNVLYDSETAATVLALDKCVSSGQAWDEALPPGTSFSGELSMLDAASCPSSLGKDLEEFNEYFRAKVVIFAGSPAAPEACSGDFYGAEDWTERLSRAGAAGVIHLSFAVNQVSSFYFIYMYIALKNASPHLFGYHLYVKFVTLGRRLR